MPDTNTIEKIYCTPQGGGGGGNDMMTAMLAGNGGMGGQWNNPFIYLVWMMFAQRMWGNDGGLGGGNAQTVEIQNQLATMRTQMENNQNTNLIRDAIAGNGAAIGQLASNLNCDFNSLKDSICCVQGAIQNVAGQVGFSAERVINAVNMGDCNVIQAIQNCCCQTQKAIIETAAENRLATCQQTNTLSNAIQGGNFALQQTLTGLGFQSQQQTCQLLQNGNDNTQRIIDALNGHWQQDLRDKLFDMSQQAQTANIVAQLKTSKTS